MEGCSGESNQIPGTLRLVSGCVLSDVFGYRGRRGPISLQERWPGRGLGREYCQLFHEPSCWLSTGEQESVFLSSSGVGR